MRLPLLPPASLTVEQKDLHDDLISAIENFGELIARPKDGALLELVIGLLVMVGLFTRIAAFIASGIMAVVYFWQHQPHALWPHANHGELAVLYCFAFFLLVFTGGGAYALDAGRRPAGAAATIASVAERKLHDSLRIPQATEFD
jgi:uncharacterized membrane protein YphA (DoxX/SURF4 family)